ncbi:3-oxoacyl-(acyl-carrier-protein) synthase II [Gammaproteobacteria bacterium]|nr:3-oxoacyl-(acyl-carrier-protein) synthase II [Gammaproteobacteria bacterium]
MNKPIYLSDMACICALGNNLDEIRHNLINHSTQKMIESDKWLIGNNKTLVGKVNQNTSTKMQLPSIDFPEHNSRNNQLLLAALMQIQKSVNAAIAQYGPDRIAIIIGTSTSGIDEGDAAIKQYLINKTLPNNYYYQQQELGDPALFLAKYLKTTGPAYSISTACSSSVRAIISGQRMILSGMVDVAIVGGVDTLCRLAINGFNSLASLSSKPCTPFAIDRDGINISEGAGLILLSKQAFQFYIKPNIINPIVLLGIGESSDAYHISAPHPQGDGAARAMKMALEQAQLEPAQIGYINLHGTATMLNDQAETIAVQSIFGDLPSGEDVPCSSTKHLTGHALGAAGIVEAAICALILSEKLDLPIQDFSQSAQDKTLAKIKFATKKTQPKKATILSNSFAFGGNNACFILGTQKWIDGKIENAIK